MMIEEIIKYATIFVPLIGAFYIVQYQTKELVQRVSSLEKNVDDKQLFAQKTYNEVIEIKTKLQFILDNKLK
jgi:hypothetical protein